MGPVNDLVPIVKGDWLRAGSRKIVMRPPDLLDVSGYLNGYRFLGPHCDFRKIT